MLGRRFGGRIRIARWPGHIVSSGRWYEREHEHECTTADQAAHGECPAPRTYHGPEARPRTSARSGVDGTRDAFAELLGQLREPQERTNAVGASRGGLRLALRSLIIARYERGRRGSADSCRKPSCSHSYVD